MFDDGEVREVVQILKMILLFSKIEGKKFGLCCTAFGVKYSGQWKGLKL